MCSQATQARGVLAVYLAMVLTAPTRGLPARGLPTPGQPSSPPAKRDLENDIDFDGPVSSGEREPAPEMMAVMNQARDAGVNAEQTIAEVQRILDKYPQLPRLSRGDILSILDNITRSADLGTTTAASTEPTTVTVDFTTSDWTALSTEETATTQASSMEQVSGAGLGSVRGDHGRELMVVLPFNAKNLSEINIKELYTRAPLTHIIGDPTTAKG